MTQNTIAKLVKFVHQGKFGRQTRQSIHNMTRSIDVNKRQKQQTKHIFVEGQLCRKDT